MTQDSLRDLKARLAQCNLHSPDVRDLLCRHVLAEKARLQETCEDLSGCLDAAVMLVESVGQVDGREADELQSVLTRLLDVVADARERRTTGATDAQSSARGGGDDALGVLNRMAVGEVLVQLGFITPEVADDALRRSTAARRPMGEVLVEEGAIDAGDLERALALQRSLNSHCPDAAGTTEPRPHAVHRVLLGELLVARGAIDRGQLERGLAEQRRTGRRLGETLIVLGFLTAAQLDQAIDVQS